MAQGKITLEDHHPGEYTNFKEWAEKWAGELRQFNRDLKEAGGPGTPGWPVAYADAEYSIAFDDPYDEAGDADYEAPTWTIEGPTSLISHLYHQLLARLVSPAWDDYGMGGDDNCYDYWPNTMILAADLRDALIPLVEAGTMGQGYGLDGPRLTDELRRVYWLCRDRYAKATREEAKMAEDDSYFETDILSSERFGDRP